MGKIKSRIGHLLKTNKLAKISEILIVFSPGLFIINIINSLENRPVQNMVIIWVANVTMLFLVWSGIKLRGQSWSDFGLSFKRVDLKGGLRVFGLSLLVCALGGLAYMLGSVFMANFTSMPEPADMSNYDYLRNNLFMLLSSLFGVYIVSSFGEEVIYRAFLINRITELGFDTKFGRIMAVVLSAVVFGLAHYQWGPTGVVSTGFMGLVMGLFYLKFNKNLWILVLAHAYLDTILLVPLFLGSN